MLDFLTAEYAENTTNEEKCRLWIDWGLAHEQECEILKAIMDEHNPQTANDNKLVFAKLLFLAGDLKPEEYLQIPENIQKG